MLPAVYLDAGDFSNGTALVKVAEGEYALIDLHGVVLHTYKHAFVGYPGDGLLAFQATADGKIRLSAHRRYDCYPAAVYGSLAVLGGPCGD
ncbi:hypothetical protein ACFTAO_29450 [Paenibacillus rhizoplanae]